MLNKEKGFTLAELVASVIILLILAVVISVFLMGYIKDARLASDIQEAKEIKHEMLVKGDRVGYEDVELDELKIEVQKVLGYHQNEGTNLDGVVLQNKVVRNEDKIHVGELSMPVSGKSFDLQGVQLRKIKGFSTDVYKVKEESEDGKGEEVEYEEGVEGELVEALESEEDKGYVVTASDVGLGRKAYRLFDKQNTRYDVDAWGVEGNTLSETSPEWVAIELPGKGVVRSYEVSRSNGAAYPVDFELQGSHDGENFTTLDKRGNLRFVEKNQKATFSAYHEEAYKFFRIYVTKGTGEDFNIGELNLKGTLYKEKVEDMPLGSGGVEGELVEKLGADQDKGYVVEANTVAFGRDAYRVFDKQNTRYGVDAWGTNNYTLTKDRPAWVKVDLPGKGVVREYELSRSNGAAYPVDFELQGSVDGETFVTLDKRSDVVFETTNVTKTFYVGSESAYGSYRLYITKSAGRAFNLGELNLIGTLYKDE